MNAPDKLITFALIPARKGSKGLKNKNILSLNNKELIQYTLEASLESKFIDKTFISTDSKYIKDKYKDDCTIIDRPKQLCSDSASSASVVKHFIGELEEKFDYPNYNIVYLQPTSPLRQAAHIDDCLDKMVKHGSASAVSVAENYFSPFKSFRIDQNNCLASLFDESMTNMRRQDLPKTYRANGAIYIFTKNDFIDNNGFPSNNGYAYLMDDNNSKDIDSINDLDEVKEILKNRNIHEQ